MIVGFLWIVGQAFPASGPNLSLGVLPDQVS